MNFALMTLKKNTQVKSDITVEKRNLDFLFTVYSDYKNFIITQGQIR